MQKLLSPAEATEKILFETRDFGLEKVLLEFAEGHILAENWLADRDFPPFDRSAMDGIAIRFSDFEHGKRDFEIVATQPAGLPAVDFSGFFSNQNLNEKSDLEKAVCLEIMTGAVVPPPFDLVVRFEDLEMSAGHAFLKITSIQKGQNIHRKGADRHAGDLLAEPFRHISAAEIAVAATIGKTEILVKKKPLALVISTGDELVEVAETPLDHQIRRSNAHAVAAFLQRNGCRTQLFHLKDDAAAIRFFIEKEASRADFLIFSGGVSAGRFDFLPEVLAEMGCRKILHGVRQRPGKPIWVGVFDEFSDQNFEPVLNEKNGDGNDETPPKSPVVFGLPGNPVSTFFCLIRYVLPWLRASFGLAPFEKKWAVLAENVAFRPALDYFLQVKIHFSDAGNLVAKPVAGGGSGDLANLLEADAFLHLPAAERDFFEAGAAFEVFFLSVKRCFPFFSNA